MTQSACITLKMVIVPVATIGRYVAMNSNFLEDKSPLLHGVDRSAVFWRKVLHEVKRILFDNV